MRLGLEFCPRDTHTQEVLSFGSGTLGLYHSYLTCQAWPRSTSSHNPLLQVAMRMSSAARVSTETGIKAAAAAASEKAIASLF